MIAGNAFDNGDEIVLDAARSKELWRDNPNDFGDASDFVIVGARDRTLSAPQYRRLQRLT